MFGKTPVRLSYSVVAEAAIYAPGAHTPSALRGSGYATYSFTATDEPHLLSVTIEDIRIEFLPFVLAIDIDGDGKVETIELTNLKFDTSFLDRKSCTGTLDLETGDFDLTVAVAITPGQVPLLAALGGGQGVRLSAAERGRMNLRTLSYRLSVGVIDVTDGPLSGFRITNCSTEGTVGGPEPEPTINLYINANPKSVPFGLTPIKPSMACSPLKSVVICPGDAVMLCWEANAAAVKHVTILPEPWPGAFAQLGPSGDNAVIPKAASASSGRVEYVATTVNYNSTKPAVSDSVSAIFYRGEWLGPFEAAPDPETNMWILDFPHDAHGRAIAVAEVSLTPQGKSKPCLQHNDWFLRHWPALPPYGPGGTTPDFSSGITLAASLVIPAAQQFRAIGRWGFKPMGANPPDPRRGGPPVCFRLRGECRPL